MISRRSFVTGLISFVAAPAIVRPHNLMPVKVVLRPIITADAWHPDAEGHHLLAEFVSRNVSDALSQIVTSEKCGLLSCDIANSTRKMSNCLDQVLF